MFFLFMQLPFILFLILLFFLLVRDYPVFAILIVIGIIIIVVNEIMKVNEVKWKPGKNKTPNFNSSYNKKNIYHLDNDNFRYEKYKLGMKIKENQEEIKRIKKEPKEYQEKLRIVNKDEHENRMREIKEQHNKRMKEIQEQYEVEMKKIKEKEQELQKNTTSCTNYNFIYDNDFELNDKSALMKLGYNLKKSEKERHKILKEKAIPLLGKEKCIKFLEFQIRLKENIITKDYSNAINKWQGDIEYILNYDEGV